MKFFRWGPRLSGAIAEALKFRKVDDVEIQVADATTQAIARTPSRNELLIRLRAFQGRLPADFKFDRDEANAR